PRRKAFSFRRAPSPSRRPPTSNRRTVPHELFRRRPPRKEDRPRDRQRSLAAFRRRACRPNRPAARGNRTAGSREAEEGRQPLGSGEPVPLSPRRIVAALPKRHRHEQTGNRVNRPLSLPCYYLNIRSFRVQTFFPSGFRSDFSPCFTL